MTGECPRPGKGSRTEQTYCTLFRHHSTHRAERSRAHRKSRLSTGSPLTAHTPEGETKIQEYFALPSCCGVVWCSPLSSSPPSIVVTRRWRRRMLIQPLSSGAAPPSASPPPPDCGLHRKCCLHFLAYVLTGQQGRLRVGTPFPLAWASS